mgnify:CR=1 FL=1
MKPMKKAKTPCQQGVDTVSAECGHTKTRDQDQDQDQGLALEENVPRPMRFRDGLLGRTIQILSMASQASWAMLPIRAVKLMSKPRSSLLP